MAPKPTPTWLLAALLLAACSKTPLDVLDATSMGAGGQTCSAAPAALAGVYRIRSVSSNKCLGVGSMITVGGLPGRLTAMVDDCVNDAETFQLMPEGTFGSFELHASIGDYLDIEMLGTADGTRVIYFARNGLANQRFTFDARRDRVFALIPGNVTTSCISDVQPQPEIFACKSDASNQEWELLPATCD